MPPWLKEAAKHSTSAKIYAYYLLHVLICMLASSAIWTQLTLRMHHQLCAKDALQSRCHQASAIRPSVGFLLWAESIFEQGRILNKNGLSQKERLLSGLPLKFSDVTLSMSRNNT